jgi:hypothetical protein
MSDGAGGRVVAGQPLGIHQRELAGLDRDLQAGMEDPARSVGGIHLELDEPVLSRGSLAGQQCASGGNEAKAAKGCVRAWSK